MKQIGQIPLPLRGICTTSRTGRNQHWIISFSEETDLIQDERAALATQAHELFQLVAPTVL